jgi:hypothetical protein
MVISSLSFAHHANLSFGHANFVAITSIEEE